MVELITDKRGVSVQAFSPKPTLSLEPITIPGASTVVFGGAADAYLLSKYGVLVFYTASTDVTRYFNADNTKTRTLIAGVENVVVVNSGMEKLTLVNNSGAPVVVEVEGM